MFAFRLDARSGVPTYLQLVGQVKQAVLLGYLQPGDQLPTVREVAADLAINPNTVAKAYRELEREGLVAARSGQGTFVQTTIAGVDPATYARLRHALRRWVREAHAAGLDQQRVAAVMASVLDEAAGAEGVA
ncbi:MAG TPA: GntR family transcriptional regulator [Actinomycetes bacterium]|nr:GntR family transcriptional regulator [Actinomycetes bacterium]